MAFDGKRSEEAARRTWDVRRKSAERYNSAKRAMAYLQDALTECDDLRHPEYRGNANPFAGHCYVASEALYHLGARDAGFTPRVASCISPEGKRVTHWWLENVNGSRFDPTWSQFDLDTLRTLYAVGRGCGFLTVEPSKRARTLIRRTAGGHYARCYPHLAGE
jgi:hypothetical protein